MVLAQVGSDGGRGTATSQGLLVKLLDCLATLMALAAEPWTAPSHKAWPHLSAYCFGSERCLNPSFVWAGDLLACVDGAHDTGRWRVGALVPFFGVRSFYPPHRKYASQQTTELHAVAWAVRLAVRLGMSSVIVCSDSEVALAQVLSLRACSHLQHQQAILRSLAVFLCSAFANNFTHFPSLFSPHHPTPSLPHATRSRSLSVLKRFPLS